MIWKSDVPQILCCYITLKAVFLLVSTHSKGKMAKYINRINNVFAKVFGNKSMFQIQCSLKMRVSCTKPEKLISVS